MTKITLKRLNDAVHFVAKNEQGLSIEMDGSTAVGGVNAAPRPMEVLLMSLAGCSSIDVVSILKKQRQPLLDIEVEVEGLRIDGEIPSVFRKVNIIYTLYGDIDTEKAQKAAQLSIEKYCSVTAMIRSVADIKYEVKVVKKLHFS